MKLHSAGQTKQGVVSSDVRSVSAKEAAKANKPRPETVQEGAEIITKALRDHFSDGTAKVVDDDRIVVHLFPDTFEEDMSALLDILVQGNLMPGFTADSPLNYRWRIGKHSVGLSMEAQGVEA